MLHHGGSIVNTTVIHHYRVMSREDPQMKIRLPSELKDDIEEAAKANNRSMNAEIVARLQESFEERRSPDEIHSRMNALASELSLAIKLIGELRELAEERRRNQS